MSNTTIELTLTNAGLQALINAQANGTAAVAITSYGISEVALVATPDLTTLPNELKRIGSVSGGIVSPNTIHVVLQDMSSDAYTLRAFALYLSDGTLFAIYGQADPILIKTAGADLLLATDIQFANTDVTNIAFGATNFFNPPATETVIGVARLATQDETNAGTDDLTIVTPKKLAGAGYARRAGDTFTGPIGVTTSAGDASLTLNRGGAVIGVLVAQGDRNLVLYRNDGSGPVPVFGINSQSGPFAVAMPITRMGYTVWDAGNDGAGSGLDADLLDGRDSGFFTDIAARLGYVPANRAGDTFTGDVSVVHAGNVNLILNSSGAVIAKLVAQADGNIVCYRNTGSGDLMVWSCDGTQLNAGFPIVRQGQKVWDAGNDGAGSGLDADLLDGQDSSYYTDILGRLGYRPANKAGDTFDGEVSVLRLRARSNGDGQAVAIGDDAWIGDGNITSGVVVRGQNNAAEGYIAFGSITTGLGCYANDATLRYGGNPVWHAGNDGAGSGLDADLLDGQDSSYYTNIIGRLGYTPVRQGGGPGQGSNLLNIGWSGSRVRVAVDGSDQGNIVTDPVAANATIPFNGSAMRRNGNDLWGPENDGSGSGLDADLLDGREASSFANAGDFGFGSNDNGYWEKRPNGVVEQWGTVAGRTSEGAVSIVFPVAYTDVASVRVTPTGVNLNGNNRYDMIVQRVVITTTGATIYCQYTANDNSSAILDQVDWRAIGRNP